MKISKTKEFLKKNKKSIYLYIFFTTLLILTTLFINKRIETKLTIEKAHTANIIFNVISNQFNEIISDTEEELSDWAEEVESGTTSFTCDTQHTRHLEGNELVINYGIIDKLGYSVCSRLELAEGFNFNDEVGEYTNLVKNETFTITNFGYSQSTGLARIGFGFPVFDSNGDFNGSVWTSLSLERINQEIEALNIPEDAELLITDKYGSVLVTYPENLSLLGEKKFSTKIFSLILAQKSGSIITKEEGREMIYIYKPYYFNDSNTPVSFIIYGTENPNIKVF